MYKNILLIIFSVLIVIVVVELLLRLYAPVYHAGYVGVYQYDEEIGALLKPDVHYFNTTDYQQEIKTNHLGTVNFQESFQDYNKIIFALGDSYTQGTGLPADASYPAQLDLLLNIRSGVYRKEFGVVNLGLAAFGAEQSILTLLRYKDIIGAPDFILFTGTANDNLDDLKFRQGYKHRNFVEGSPVWGIFVKPLQWFRNDFEIGKRLFFIADAFRERKIQGTEHNIDGNNAVTPVAELQIDMFEKLSIHSDSLGSHLIISWADSPGGDGSYEYLKNWADEHNILFADWYPQVASVREAVTGLPLENSHSGGHYRTWVNQIIARSFADLIVRVQ